MVSGQYDKAWVLDLFSMLKLRSLRPWAKPGLDWGVGSFRFRTLVDPINEYDAVEDRSGRQS